MAYDKLCRGEFSASPRVYTFLSTVSRYQVSVRHVAGAAISPSDDSSRNAAECKIVCLAINGISCSYHLCVRHQGWLHKVTIHHEICMVSHTAKVPRPKEDVRAPLRDHAPFARRQTKKDIKRYLNVATKASDELLVVKRNESFVPAKELIIIPRSVLHGPLTSIHLQLSHPSTF